MLTTILLTALALPQSPTSRPSTGPKAGLQDPKPTSRPTSRPTSTDPDNLPARIADATWGKDAPGRAVMKKKFMPIVGGRYTSADKVSDRVRPEDLVIGLVVRGKAFAYPINMLGGPQREIINEEYGGVPFCVNW